MLAEARPHLIESVLRVRCRNGNWLAVVTLIKEAATVGNLRLQLSIPDHPLLEHVIVVVVLLQLGRTCQLRLDIYDSLHDLLVLSIDTLRLSLL